MRQIAERLPLMSVMVWAPLLGAVVVAALPTRARSLQRLAAWVGMGTAALAFGAVAALFVKGEPGFQLIEDYSWIGSFGARYLLGIDGVSLLMTGLTVVLFPVCLWGTADSIKQGEKWYLFLLLLLETSILGAFSALDLLLFFVFWEAVLVPMYFLIAGWGSERRAYAAVKFFLYTMAGSAFLLVGIVYLAATYYAQTGSLSFDLRVLESTSIPKDVQVWLFGAFAAGFAVKVPVFPLHTWLPDAHTEAPTAGSVILAGVLLKLGVYGFLRYAIPLFPEGARRWLPVMVVLGLIGIVYGAAVSIVQTDLKRLIAYSSVSHLGFSVVGVFAATLQSAQGGVLQMLNHGVSTGALFLLFGMVYDRLHTRRIADLGGLWSKMPRLGGLFLVAALASIGLPGLGGFVGEFLVIVGGYLKAPWIAAIAASGMVLSAVYMLWAFQRCFLGPPSSSVEQARDVGARQVVAAVPLVALMVIVGLAPKPFLDATAPSVSRVVSALGPAEVDSMRPAKELATSGSVHALETHGPVGEGGQLDVSGGASLSSEAGNVGEEAPAVVQADTGSALVTSGATAAGVAASTGTGSIDFGRTDGFTHSADGSFVESATEGGANG